MHLLKSALGYAHTSLIATNKDSYSWIETSCVNDIILFTNSEFLQIAFHSISMKVWFFFVFITMIRKSHWRTDGVFNICCFISKTLKNIASTQSTYRKLTNI